MRTAVMTRRVVALVALAAVVVAACGSTERHAADPARLPAVVLPHLGEDAALDLDAIDGSVVINLWATWCAPCRRELPDFEQVHLELGDEVRFIGVNLGDRATDASRFIAEVGVTFDQYLDADGTLNQQLGTATLPVTVITDNQGRIALLHSGPMNAEELRAAIAIAQG
jgi:cytochrome c biogenesis protein CcmG/thiol:disulfide interchange protein DsbE